MVPLSDAEKSRIEQEEKERDKVRERIKHRRQIRGCLTLVFLLVVFGYLLTHLPSNHKEKATSPTKSSAPPKPAQSPEPDSEETPASAINRVLQQPPLSKKQQEELASAMKSNAPPKPAEPPEPSYQVRKERETVSVGYMSFTVWRSWWSNQLSNNEFLDKHPNAMFLFVKLTVQNNDYKPHGIPAFTLMDENLAEYETTPYDWAVDGSFGIFERLNPSVGKQGFIVFDVPKDRKYCLRVSLGYVRLLGITCPLGDAYVQLSPRSSQFPARRVKGTDAILDSN
jgi:hypothetical protein